MCAGSFAAPKLVLDHNSGPGHKLNVTGGGKCNFTKRTISARDYVSSRKHFCHAALAAFPLEHLLYLLKQAHIPFTENEQGQFFARSARDITDFLFARAKQQNTTFSFHTQVLQIVPQNGLFCVHTNKGNFYANHVVLASGGPSYPALGATAFAWSVAQKLGLAVLPPRPALVGLQAPKPFKEICRSLAGNSLDVIIRTGKHSEEGALLFTHEGISGPAVLQTSLYWQEGQNITLNFLPQTDALAFLRSHKNETALFSKILSPLIPVKISKALLGVLDVRAADAPKDTLLAAANTFNQFTFCPTGTAGYTHAEVTAGGIDTAQIDPITLQCKRLPGLFIIGEALDVTGRVGGLNLHWAWASARAAARALCAS